MKRMRILGLALVALCAVFAVSAVTASAAPEWAVCGKATKVGKEYTGKYSDKECKTETTGGKYELEVGSVGKGKAFKIKNIGNQTLHSVVPGTGDVPITCTKLKGSATPVAPNKVAGVNLEFGKCTTLGGSVPCENVKKETIKTNTLAGVLAEVEGKVGTILFPESSEYFVTFECGAVFPKVRVKDSVFGEYTGATNVISKVSIGHYTIGPYFGEVEYEPGKKYTPLVNHPTEGPPTYGVLHTEAKNAETEAKYKSESNPEGWGPPGGLPSGQEGETELKGEAVKGLPR
jgi:hypothetical protein